MRLSYFFGAGFAGGCVGRQQRASSELARTDWLWQMAETGGGDCIEQSPFFCGCATRADWWNGMAGEGAAPAGLGIDMAGIAVRRKRRTLLRFQEEKRCG
jgi:hypothetical protein